MSTKTQKAMRAVAAIADMLADGGLSAADQRALEDALAVANRHGRAW